MKASFSEIIDILEKFYGSPHPLPESDPFEIILRENVAYLVNDEQRERAFDALRDRIGLTPADILSASPEDLLSVAEMGGPMPDLRVEKAKRPFLRPLSAQGPLSLFCPHGFGLLITTS